MVVGEGSTLQGAAAPGLRLLLQTCLTSSPRAGGGGAGAWGSRNGMAGLRRSLWTMGLRLLAGTHLSAELSAEREQDWGYGHLVVCGF